ncbi:uncharacterized protein, partial [Triticum aestivum]|uniref:uncharacterized protein n=1 Tax=Triticum aestivum TaxID=4565 RepID=UPI001D01304B
AAGFEFPADPIDRFPLPDLAVAEYLLCDEVNQSLLCAVAQYSNSGAGETATVQQKFDHSFKRGALSNSEQSTDKDDGHAPDSSSRFQLPEVTICQQLVNGEASQTLVCTAAESGIGDVGDPPPTIQVDINSTCNGMALSLPTSEQSTGKDDPQAPGWTKRVRVGHTPIYIPPKVVLHIVEKIAVETIFLSLFISTFCC